MIFEIKATWIEGGKEIEQWLAVVAISSDRAIEIAKKELEKSSKNVEAVWTGTKFTHFDPDNIAYLHRNETPLLKMI